MEAMLIVILTDEVASYPNMCETLACLLTKGLAFIHSKGCVHCNIKPSNILVSPPSSLVPPCIKTADFGLSKKVERNSGP